MDLVVEQWLERAKYDLETARGMVKIRKYLYAVFMCQQSLEKLLKAYLAKAQKTILMTHHLPRLAHEINIYEDCEKMDPGLLAELTPYCIKARYGEYKRKLSELCSKKTAIDYLKRTERLYQWLNKKLKSKK